MRYPPSQTRVFQNAILLGHAQIKIKIKYDHDSFSLDQLHYQHLISSTVFKIEDRSIRPLMVLVLGSKISELPLSLEKFTNINRRYHGLCPTVKYFIAFESKHILSFFTSVPKHSLSFFLSFFFSPFIICVYRYPCTQESIYPSMW